MNIDNIKLLRNHIAKLSDEEFDIRKVSKCFCHHAYEVTNNECGIDYLFEDPNITRDLAMPLNWKTRTDITIPVACAVLDNLINTGKVDWDYAIANPAKLDEMV